jgi:hypothetical protein
MRNVNPVPNDLYERATEDYRRRFGNDAALISANYSTFDDQTGVLVLRDGDRELAHYEYDEESDQLRFVPK